MSLTDIDDIYEGALKNGAIGGKIGWSRWRWLPNVLSK